MTKTKIEEKLKNLIAPYVENKEAFETVNEKTDMLQDLEINSAHLVDIILDMEEEFDVAIDDDSAEKMLTVGEAIDIIEKLLKEKD